MFFYETWCVYMYIGMYIYEEQFLLLHHIWIKWSIFLSFCHTAVLKCLLYYMRYIVLSYVMCFIDLESRSLVYKKRVSLWKEMLQKCSNLSLTGNFKMSSEQHLIKKLQEEPKRREMHRLSDDWQNSKVATDIFKL